MQEMELTGNEAIAWASKCIGVDLATGYPGLPCSSIINTLKDISEPENLHVEWAANERIAIETAFGVAISGGRAICVQKMVGLNVALDSLMVMNILGTLGGLVLAVGDVPGSIFSGNEQDSRNLGAFAEIPVLEPSTPQEAFDFTIQAFEISEQYGLPVILRFTKGFALKKGLVRFDRKLPEHLPITSNITRRYAAAQSRVDAHRRLHEKMALVRQDISQRQINETFGEGNKAIVSSGYTCLKIRETIENEGLADACKLIKIGSLNPVPETFLFEQLKDVNEVIAIEEIEPHLEDMLRVFANKNKLNLTVFGKTSGQVQWEGELAAQHIGLSLKWFLGDRQQSAPDLLMVEPPPVGNELTGFCDDCPYDYYFTELKAYLADRQLTRPVFTGEPGCSIYLEAEPYEMLDAKVSLGSSLGVACGLAHVQKDREVVAIVGDSSFFHSEIQTLAHASHAGLDLIAMIVYNHAAGVTGRQPNPATGFDLRGRQTKKLEISEIAASCQVSMVKTVKGKDKAALWGSFDQIFNATGVRVLILDDPCPLI